MCTTVECGWNSGRMGADVTYYVEMNGKRYQHFLRVYAYPQDAFNTNSDNMWFPMPSNRMVCIDAPHVNCRTFISVIGCR